MTNICHRPKSPIVAVHQAVTCKEKFSRHRSSSQELQRNKNKVQDQQVNKIKQKKVEIQKQKRINVKKEIGKEK